MRALHYHSLAGQIPTLLVALVAFAISCSSEENTPVVSGQGGAAGTGQGGVAGSGGTGLGGKGGSNTGGKGGASNGGTGGVAKGGSGGVTEGGVEDGSPEADVASEPEPCIVPTAGLKVSSNTTLCAGTYDLPVNAGESAIEIVADNVTLKCDGTVLQGAASWGTTENYTAGLRVGSNTGITIQGCTIKGYRYGVAAIGSSQLTLQSLHLDDNFTDPNAGWVQDTVQGGGVRLENVKGGSVTDGSMARNWNAVELRGASAMTIKNIVADHCSNTGATLVAAANNRLEDNDFSWAVRGGLTYPSHWYGVDTKDSAGIILDSGSHDNQLIHNNATYGGDGIFIRAVIGACAPDNIVENNDTSYSPHNAIECWCDGNQFINNIASHSNYGIWTGGADNAVLRGNTVEDSRVDGISIQIGEDRHTVIEDNTVTGSGRVGVLLTGREYQEWEQLTNWKDNPANSSHLILQRNTIHTSADYDIFVTSTRSLVLASNCGAGTGSPKTQLGQLPTVTDPNDVTSTTVGSCGGATGRNPPTALLAPIAKANVGQPLALDASGSTPAVAGDTLSYVWLVQPSGTRFTGSKLPAFALNGPGPATTQVTISSPGIYDVDVTVHDGHLAALAFQQVAAVPVGNEVSTSPSSWTYTCSSCTTTFTEESSCVDGSCLRIHSNAPYELTVLTPQAKNLNLNVSSKAHLGFFVRATNPNANGWQGNWPVVVLASSSGTITYSPAANLLPTSGTDWVYVTIPLAGGQGWTRTVSGGSLSKVDWVEFHSDTWGGDPFDIWYDAITFY